MGRLAEALGLSDDAVEGGETIVAKGALFVAKRA